MKKYIEEGLNNLEKKIVCNGYSYIVREIPNGDFFVFFELNPNKTLTFNLDNVLSVTKMDENYVKPTQDNRYGYNKLSGWQSLIKTSKEELVFSKS